MNKIIETLTALMNITVNVWFWIALFILNLFTTTLSLSAGTTPVFGFGGLAISTMFIICYRRQLTDKSDE